MAYQIGQLRDSNITDISKYFKSIDTEEDKNIIVETAFTNISFNDVGLKTVGEDIAVGNNYYLSFTVDRYKQGTFIIPDGGSQEVDVETLNFSLCLLKAGAKTDTYAIEQILDNYTILPYPPNEDKEENQKVNFEVMFSSNSNDILRIGFILVRNLYDYRGTIPLREIKLKVNSFGIIKNILPEVVGENSKADKIGVQSKPGFLMCINGEPIRVGRTGVYEINNGVPINFFGIATLKEHYILDCAWDG